MNLSNQSYSSSVSYEDFTHRNATDIFETGTVVSETIQWRITDVLSYFYFVVGGVGLIGNSFVILVIFNFTAMRKDVTNMFITNQSVVDLLTSLLLILGILFGDRGQQLSGIGGELFCRLWLNKALQWCTQVVSTYNLLAVTLERYLCVVYPIKYKNHVSTTKAAIAIVIIWIAGCTLQLLIAVPPAGLLEGKCNLLRFWPSREFQRGVGVFAILLKFFIPMFVMAYCYVKMVVVLKNRIHPSGSSNAKLARSISNIFKTLAIVTACFVACWVCNQVYFFMFNLGYQFKNVFSNPFYHFTVIMVYLNGIINPFIYIAQYEKFQKGVLRLRSRFICLKPNEGNIRRDTSNAGSSIVGNRAIDAPQNLQHTDEITIQPAGQPAP